MPLSHVQILFSPKSLTMDLTLWVSVLTTPCLRSRGVITVKYSSTDLWGLLPKQFCTNDIIFVNHWQSVQKARHLSTFFSMSSTSSSCWTLPSLIQFMWSSFRNNVCVYRHIFSISKGDHLPQLALSQLGSRCLFSGFLHGFGRCENHVTSSRRKRQQSETHAHCLNLDNSGMGTCRPLNFF